tara:strand:- start:5048 stop:11038 length:5991 start_codon:yes stop_codon:yes gene_type:complete
MLTQPSLVELAAIKENGDMGDNRNFAALEWVTGEISQTLKDARQALESFVENPQDSTHIRFCLTHIHQVYGSLLLVEFYGAALMAEEMENLAEAMMNEQVNDLAEAQEVLMRAILQFPLYLEKVKTTRRDHPVMVLPLLNDLRTVRGESLLTETKLFTPSLAAAKVIAGSRLPQSQDNAVFLAMLSKLVKMYQYAAAGILRGVKLDENLAYLIKVFQRLHKLSQGTAKQSLWKIALALAEGLANDSISLSVSIKNLLRQLNREIKILHKHGIKALDVSASDELLKNLLYYIACAGEPTAANSAQSQVFLDYDLANAMPEGGEMESAQADDMLAAPDSETLRSVVSALKDELDSIKHVLDVSISGIEIDDPIDQSLLIMQRVADTMAVLGIGNLRKQVQAQCEILAAAGSSSAELSHDLLMGVASSIIEIENNLDAVAAGQVDAVVANTVGASVQIDQALACVLRESRNGLEHVKDSIVEFIASQWNPEHLQSVPATLREIRGGLDIIPLPRPAKILGACANYIEEQLLQQQHTPQWSTLNKLADAIVSVEYYLERISSERRDDDELLLITAEDSVAVLGYPVGVGGIELGLAATIITATEQVTTAAIDGAATDTDILADITVDETAESLLSGFIENELDAEPELLGVEQVASATLEVSLPEGAELDTKERAAAAANSNTAHIKDVASVIVSIDHSDVAEEIVEIFVEEAQEVIATIGETFPRWLENRNDDDAIIEVRRAFHTLKGSGRMVGANDIGELAWSIENMLNHMIDGIVSINNDQCGLIENVRVLLPELVVAFRDRQPNPQQVLCDRYVAMGEAFAKVSRAELQEPTALNNQHIDTANGAETRGNSEDDTDCLLWDIFGTEAQGHLFTVEEFIADMQQAAPIYSPPSDDMQRALHTLKGSAYMAGVTPIAELVTPLEAFAKELRSYQININDDTLQLLSDVVAYTRAALEQIKQGQVVEITAMAQFCARVAELRELQIAPLVRQKDTLKDGQLKIDPKLLEIFMAEEMDLLLDAEQLLDDCLLNFSLLASMQPLQQELKTLQQGAMHANLPAMAELSDHLYRAYIAIRADGGKYTDRQCATLKEGHSQLLNMVDAVAAGQTLPVLASDLVEHLTALAVVSVAEVDAADDSTTMAVLVEPVTGSDNDVKSHHGDTASVDTVSVELDSIVAAETSFTRGEDNDDFDVEIIEIFFEEANELLEEMEQAIHNWESDWQSAEPADELKRILHTLKGGARLAGLVDIGDLSHDFETMIIANEGNINTSMVGSIHGYQDKLLHAVEKIAALLAGETPVAESVKIAPVKVTDQTLDVSKEKIGVEEAIQQPVTAPASADIIPFIAKPKASNTSAVVPSFIPPQGGQNIVQAGAAAPQLAAKRSGPQEVVKVSAELLEELVNLAGETSISRGRMEEQVNQLGGAVDEMESTIHRLQEQLRRLDIETEAQISFREEQLSDQEEFDPLEMDRYSALQQLSRSLIESASDLMDLKTTLAEKTRDSETLLLQQSRINTELQEGLMRSRMVPFSRLVPRLRRIVRQVATELGKQVSFELDNVEGELDRSVLERMVAPLEHMLRNAVDHGIEAPDERANVNKAETGRVILSLAREGGEVVLRLVDDGRGINLDRVRAKAIERGLMTEHSALSDQEVMQFILHAGFSTTESVSQISGRGIGMDVVHSEIKQLGGLMLINSKQGQGTEFTVRLPFTVSVNRALMVQIGDDRYAIPLNTIEGIVRVSPFELEHYYQDEQARFEYAGENYQVRYLGRMLDATARPKLEDQVLPLPVVLVRSAEHTVAIQVDRLMGSREIVVKTLGPQFGGVMGLSGATVMGDGSVVVILDPHAMIRKEALLAAPKTNILEPLTPTESKKARGDLALTVMVVDDSVTVRKVTGRFLEREGYEVITAKNGHEALLLLQDHIPDVMLLDIEMPRMDGFELAKNMRSSSRLKDLPIIMITSRTGDKHRQRAMRLKVNKYMGKPFQEDILLANIRALTGEADQSQ